MKKLFTLLPLLLFALLSNGQIVNGTYKIPYSNTIIQGSLTMPSVNPGVTTDDILVRKSSDGKIYRVAASDILSQVVVPTRTSLAIDQTNNTSDLNKPISTATQTALNGKVPLTRTITINGVTQDLSSNRTWTISATSTPSYTIAGISAVTGSNTLSGFLFITDANREGLFYVDAVDGTTTADNGVVFVTTGGQRIKRIYNGRVNLAWFGLVNDAATSEAASTDQRNLLNTVLSANRYGYYYIPKGTYWMNPGNVDGSSGGGNDTGIQLPSNIDIELHPEAIIRMKANALRNPNIFRIRSVENITITGGQFYGNRYWTSDASGTGGTVTEFGFCYSVADSKNLTFRDTKFFDMKGDAIYFEGEENVFVNPTAPVTQTISLPGKSKYRFEVIGSGSITASVGGVPYATVTQSDGNFYTTPGTTTATQTVLITVTGTLSSVVIDLPCWNILVDNIDVSNVRRNGITMNSGVNWTISNSKFHNTNGADPQAGIDCEPNNATMRVANGRIINCDAYDNYKYGFVITGSNVSLIGCNTARNGLAGIGRGYWIANANGNSVNGVKFFTNCTSTDDVEGFFGAGGGKLYIDGFVFKNVTTNAAFSVSGHEEVIGNNISIIGSAKEGMDLMSGNGRIYLSNINIEGAGKISGTSLNIRVSNVNISNFRVTNGGFVGVSVNSTATSNVLLYGGYVSGNARNGVTLSGTGAVLANSFIENNSFGTSSYYNVDVLGNNNRINNNMIKKGASSVRYAIRVNTGITGTIINGNDLTAGGNLGNIQDLGTGTTINGFNVIKIADVNYTQTATDKIITYTSLSGSKAITFLAPAAWPLYEPVTIKDATNSAGTNNLTIVGTVDGVVNPVAVSTNNGSRTYFSDGTAIYTKD